MALDADATCVHQSNVISFNADISACEKGGQRQREMILLHEMQNRGLSLDAITSDTAISACEKGAQWQHVAA
eukprot:10421092-Karenia_brevis.AAC.1